MKIPNKELWNLDNTLAAYILPRLIAFRRGCTGKYATFSINFETASEWRKVLDKIICAFRNILEEDTWFYTWRYQKKEKQIEEGLALFGKHFRALWS